MVPKRKGKQFSFKTFFFSFHGAENQTQHLVHAMQAIGLLSRFYIHGLINQICRNHLDFSDKLSTQAAEKQNTHRMCFSLTRALGPPLHKMALECHPFIFSPAPSRPAACDMLIC